VSYLLDTNVVSEARKPAGDPHVRAWFASTAPSGLYLSVLVLGEIRQGIERLRRRDPTQAAMLDKWLAALRRDYADRLLPVTVEIADVWGSLNAPSPLPVIDGLLAATALVHGLTLVTRNTSDVARTGVRLLNPFNPTR
jgi:toxin FitB